MVSEDGKVPSSILYDIVCCNEWKCDLNEDLPRFVIQNASLKRSAYFPSKFPVVGKLWKDGASDSIRKNIKFFGPPWQMCCSKKGNFISILMKGVLEIRSSVDHFGSPVGRSNVVKDSFPHLQLMCWNDEETLLAVSFTNGVICFYDQNASQLFSVECYQLPSQAESLKTTFSRDKATVGMFFTPDVFSLKANSRAIRTVTYKGKIKCFRQTSIDQMTFHHDFSVQKIYPRGIDSVAYLDSHGLIFISGLMDSKFKCSQNCNQDYAQQFGVTVWRITSESPYYEIVLRNDNLINQPAIPIKPDSWLRRFSFYGRNVTDNFIKMMISPCNRYLASVDANGNIYIWHLPSLTLYRQWNLKQQFQNNSENTRFNSMWRKFFNQAQGAPIDNHRFLIYDIKWWSNNIIIISRVNGSVTLSCIEEETPSKNLLGDSPEFFYSPVAVTNRFEKGFFILECEIQSKKTGSKTENAQFQTNISQERPFGSDQTENWIDFNESNYHSAMKGVIQYILYWLTDSENFRPVKKNRRKPELNFVYRLFSLRSITPMELLHQKIELEEYGAALDICGAYGLDTDLVYQRKWSKSPVTVETIKDYLSKIKKRNWVLQECLDRVPSTLDAAESLFRFGLKGTDKSAALLISQDKDEGRFTCWTDQSLDISSEDYMLLIDPENIEVKRLISYRKKFLYFIDILQTYELMLGGPAKAENDFDPDVFERMRNQPAVNCAIEMARNNELDNLRLMISRHWNDLSNSMLEILSNIPETTSPYLYKDLLPTVDCSGKVVLWKDVHERESDWCESLLLRNMHVKKSSKDGQAVSNTQIVQWYKDKIRQIEATCGMTNHALEVARLGVQNGLKDELEDDIEMLTVLETLVYDIDIPNITLNKLEQMGYMEILELVLSKADHDLAQHFRNYAVPFLNTCEEKEPGSRLHILDQYLTSISSHDLSKVLPIFQSSKPGNSNRLIESSNDMMQLCYNCVYANEEYDNSETILALLNCIPERQRDADDESTKLLHDAIDKLEKHYKISKVLKKYNMKVRMCDLRDSEHFDEDAVSDYLDNFCGSFKRTGSSKTMDWKTLLYDLLDVRKTLFHFFPIEDCFGIYVNTLLNSGQPEVILLARDFIEYPPEEISDRSKSSGIKSLARQVSSVYSSVFSLYLHVIPYKTSLFMVLEAAGHYFDSASDYMDPNIKLSKVCLSLVDATQDDEISKMHDLIDGLKILNKDFCYNVLPQTLRHCERRWPLLEKAVKATDSGYKKYQQLLKLLLYLRLSSEEKESYESLESKVLEMVGFCAFRAKDWKFCVSICHHIIAKRHHKGWKLFVDVVGVLKSESTMELDDKVSLLNYALRICPDYEILSILKFRRQLIRGEE